MSFEKAQNYLINCNLQDNIIEFNISTATVALAAEALKCTEGEIAKSLAFYIKNKPILVITAGDKKIDNSKFKNEFLVKAKMIPFDLVGPVIGHDAGGVCPFGINEGIDVYLDSSLKDYKVVYPACGSHNSAVKLTINELEKASNYLKWVDVCK